MTATSSTGSAASGETVDLSELRERALLLADSIEWGRPLDVIAGQVQNLAGLLLEQVGWADDSEPGAPVLMTMHFKPKVPSLWQPVYRLAPSGSQDGAS